MVGRPSVRSRGRRATSWWKSLERCRALRMNPPEMGRTASGHTDVLHVLTEDRPRHPRRRTTGTVVVRWPPVTALRRRLGRGLPGRGRSSRRHRPPTPTALAVADHVFDGVEHRTGPRGSSRAPPPGGARGPRAPADPSFTALPPRARQVAHRLLPVRRPNDYPQFALSGAGRRRPRAGAASRAAPMPAGTARRARAARRRCGPRRGRRGRRTAAAG